MPFIFLPLPPLIYLAVDWLQSIAGAALVRLPFLHRLKAVCSNLINTSFGLTAWRSHTSRVKPKSWVNAWTLDHFRTNWQIYFPFPGDLKRFQASSKKTNQKKDIISLLFGFCGCSPSPRSRSTPRWVLAWRWALRQAASSRPANGRLQHPLRRRRPPEQHHKQRAARW